MFDELAETIDAMFEDEGGAKRERTDWFRITLWDKQLVEAGGLRKGSPVCVDGQIRQNEWADNETGRKRRGYDFVAREGFRVLSS